MTSLYTRGQTTDFIEKVFGEGKYSNGGLNVSVLCPNCADKKEPGYNKKKLVIRTDTFLSHCWVCNTKSKNLLPWIRNWYPQYLNEYVTTFLKGQQLTEVNVEELEQAAPAVVLPEGFELLLKSKGIEASRAKSYLTRRGIFANRDYWYWKLGIAPENEDLQGRIIIPSFDSEGNLNYWTARTYNKKTFPKYLNPSVARESVIFNEINIDWKKPLTLVEGPFDLLKCNENATCLLGSTFGPDYLLFRRIVENETPVVLALDEDAKEKSIMISKSLLEYGIKVKVLEVSKEKGDVGAMTKEEFKELEADGKDFTIDNFLLRKIRMAFG